MISINQVIYDTYQNKKECEEKMLHVIQSENELKTWTSAIMADRTAITVSI